MRMLLCALIVLVTGCKTVAPEIQIRSGTTIATGGALAVMRADIATVDKVRNIAITVRDSVDPTTGNVDLILLQKEIAARIVAAFPDKDRATAIANLVNYSTALVLGYLKDRQGDAPPSVVYLYIREAAAGVVDGCNLYMPAPVAEGPRLGAQDAVAATWEPEGERLYLTVSSEALDDFEVARGARIIVLRQQDGRIVEAKVACR